MRELKYVKPERIFLKRHPDLNERWVQERIAQDPAILGLGDLVLKDKERSQPHAGRLDLLFQENDSNQRYEVEVQLGSTDESHIIRTIEYWDIERKRYPQYDHVAVIVAEDITSRFLNVISLFNGFIPLVAIQLQAFQIGDQVMLVCTTVLSQVTLGLIEEEGEEEAADRAYWEKRSTKSSLELADSLLELARAIDPTLSFKYNKGNIRLTRDGQSTRFAVLHPKKDWVRLSCLLEKSDELQARLDEAGIDVMDYDTRRGRYRLRLSKTDFEKNKELLRELLEKSYKETEG